jgi:hypothetical protein
MRWTRVGTESAPTLGLAVMFVRQLQLIRKYRFYREIADPLRQDRGAAAWPRTGSGACWIFEKFMHAPARPCGCRRTRVTCVLSSTVT